MRCHLLVTPAKAGVQFFFSLDSGFCRNDGTGGGPTRYPFDTKHPRRSPNGHRNQPYKSAANSNTGRQAAEAVKEARDTARSVGEDVSEFASDAAKQAGDFASEMSRQAGRQFKRARNAASDVYDEAHDLSVQNPHISLGLAAAFGFLLGAYLVSRR